MERRKPVVYIGQPYTHSKQCIMNGRARFGCMVAAALHRNGVLWFGPIPASHHVAQFNTGTCWESWRELDSRFVEMCDVLLVLDIPGWEESVGLQAEIDLAESLAKPILYASTLVDPNYHGWDYDFPHNKHYDAICEALRELDVKVFGEVTDEEAIAAAVRLCLVD